MGNIQNLPAALVNVIESGILERRIMDAIKPALNWDMLVEREQHPGQIGESMTKTRHGLIAPSTRSGALIAAGGDPAAVVRSVEQFSYTVKSYGSRITSYLPNSDVSIVNQFLADVEKISLHAKHSVNRFRRDVLLEAYGGGNTFATTGATSTSLVVKDATGFEYVMVQGTPTAVSVSNPGTLTLGSTSYTYTAVNTGTNTITLSGSQTWSQYDLVKRSDAATVIRQGSRATDRLIVSGDTPTIATFRAAATHLRNHNVPPIDAAGNYGCFIDPDVENALFADAEFFTAITEQQMSGTLESGVIGRYAGVVFFRQPKMEMAILADDADYQTDIHRSVMFGQGVCVEAFIPESRLVGAGGGAQNLNHVRQSIDPVLDLVIRGPQDYLGRSLDLSWIGNMDWCIPSDSKNLSGSQRFKRAVVIHTAGPAA